MNALYPIIRRRRRPLVVEPVPPVVAVAVDLVEPVKVEPQRVEGRSELKGVAKVSSRFRDQSREPADTRD